MIALRKLASLNEMTKLRKCARLLDDFAWQLNKNVVVDKSYLQEVCKLIANSNEASLSLTTKKLALELSIDEKVIESRKVGDLTLLLHFDLQLERADWDFREEESFFEREILNFTVVLDRLRSPFNVGSIFRSSDSFGVKEIVIVKPGASIEHQRAIKTARGTEQRVAWNALDENKALESLKGKNVFALELGGQNIDQFKFPDEGVVIIGSEELGVSVPFLKAADKSYGRVSIPLFGSKGSLNVSVAFGILIYKWHSAIATKGKDKK